MVKCAWRPLLLLVCMLSVFAFTPGMASCSPDGDEARKVVEEAYDKMLKIKNYHATTQASFQGQGFRADIRGESDIQVKPLLSRNVMNITMSLGDKVEKVVIQQYIEEAAGQVLLYVNPGEKWVKQVLPNSQMLLDTKNFPRNLKSVVPVSQTGNMAVYEVVMDLSQIKEFLSRQYTSMKTSPMLPGNILDSLTGDLKCTLTIDKAAGTISQVDMDLTELLAKMGESIAANPDVPAEKREILGQMFKSMNVSMTVKYSNFDAVGKITIPKEVRRVK